jgi:hypothetical protein
MLDTTKSSFVRFMTAGDINRLSAQYGPGSELGSAVMDLSSQRGSQSFVLCNGENVLGWAIVRSRERCWDLVWIKAADRQCMETFLDILEMKADCQNKRWIPIDEF